MEELRDCLQNARYVPFTSASTVDGFAQALGGAEAAAAALAAAGCRTVAIGPVTAGRMQQLGLTPDLQSAEHSLDGVIKTILADIGGEEND